MELFGTSGIRMLADRRLVELSLKVGLAVGQNYGNVAIGGDTRTSTESIKHAFVSGLLASGARFVDVGTVPTPTVALAAHGFDAGAMITASHNPPEYNGIKLLNPDGSAFDADQRRQIEEAIASDKLAAIPWHEIRSGRSSSGAIENHIERIMQDCHRAAKVKVVLDCGCGAGSVITPQLLGQLGCEVVSLNCFPSGFFPHPIEPIEANLKDLMRAVKEFNADLGIAHDGDADRMMAVDDKGRFIPGDKLFILFARQSGAKEVVTTVDASMVVDEMGFNVRRTKVGDIYVSEELKLMGDFGGEPSGAWVFPHVSLCPDGIYAASRLVAIASEQKLSDLVDALPQYPILRGSIGSDGIDVAIIGRRLQPMKPQAIDNTDGVKLNFEDGWLLVRPSGTEPKIRVTAEAKSEKRVHQLYDDGVRLLKPTKKTGRAS